VSLLRTCFRWCLHTSIRMRGTHSHIHKHGRKLWLGLSAPSNHIAHADIRSLSLTRTCWFLHADSCCYTRILKESDYRNFYWLLLIRQSEIFGRNKSNFYDNKSNKKIALIITEDTHSEEYKTDARRNCQPTYIKLEQLHPWKLGHCHV
jgi:hypothetical protein